MMDSYDNQVAFATWLEKRLIADARGDDLDSLVEAAPRDRFWLGRVASEEAARQAARDERFLRLDPCAIGFTFKPTGAPPWTFNVSARVRTWQRDRSSTMQQIDSVFIGTPLRHHDQMVRIKRAPPSPSWAMIPGVVAAS